MKQSLTVRKLTYLSIVGVLLIGVCLLIGTSTAQEASLKMTGDKATISRAYSTVSRIYEEVFNKGKLEQADTLIAAEYIDHNPIGAGGKSGIEGFKQTVRALRFAFPDLRFTVEQMIVNGDQVVTRTTMQGTHKNSFMGVDPTGKPVTVSGFDIFRVADGVVAERWGTLDGLTLMQQIDVFIPMAWQYTLLGVLDQKERKPLITEMSKTAEKKKDVFKSDRQPVTELVHLDQLMHHFQADTGYVRVVALLSPG
ncbi:ester cyclase [Candidatus Poribacteria bacterium]|nr:ester cyclase [Candidatus Poribacteria bacterium]